jgi:hypothetical protein
MFPHYRSSFFLVTLPIAKGKVKTLQGLVRVSMFFLGDHRAQAGPLDRAQMEQLGSDWYIAYTM